MKIIEHNLDQEKRLIELLGYNLIGPDGSNRWIIFDKSKVPIGFIQYKKLHNSNPKKEYSKIFGYHTFIDSNHISYECIRELNDKYGNLKNIDYSYCFKIKRENDEIDDIEINLGDYPSLTLWSKEYGFMDFKTDYNGLYLNYKSKTDNYNIKETIVYRKNEVNPYKEYTYQISYSKKDGELSSDNQNNISTREITGIQYFQNVNLLKIIERTWINEELITNRETDVKGTVDEMVKKHQMGIDSFSHFRFLIGKLIPFDKKFISVIIENNQDVSNSLSLFLSNKNKEENNKNLKKVSK